MYYDIFVIKFNSVLVLPKFCRISLALMNRSNACNLLFNLIITLHVGIDIHTLVLEINIIGMEIVEHLFDT